MKPIFWFLPLYNNSGSCRSKSTRSFIEFRSLRKAQPKFIAKIDFAEHMQFQGREASESSLGDEGTNTAPLDNFRKSFNLEGVINLSHTGKRLAVLRLLDADTESMIGRIQARFSDKVWPKACRCFSNYFTLKICA